MRLYGGVLAKTLSSAQRLLPVLAVLVMFALLAGLSVPVYAIDTEIGVGVCGTDAPGAYVNITQPNDDSVVDQPTTTFRGSVNNSSQIDIEIDGEYASTLGIGIGQSTFATDISLTEGTHTVVMKANDVCGGQDGSDSVVITYTPAAAQPSSGDATPTTVDGRVTLDEAPAINEGLTDNDVALQIEQMPVIGAAVSIVSDFVAAIGLESTVSSGNASTVTGVARVTVTVAALTAVVMASSFAPIAAQSIPGVSELFNASNHRSMIYLEWVIRGIGVLAMALAYFI